MVDRIAVGHKARCDQLYEDLDRPVPINNLDELRCCAGRQLSTEDDADTLKILQRAFVETFTARLVLCLGA